MSPMPHTLTTAKLAGGFSHMNEEKKSPARSEQGTYTSPNVYLGTKPTLSTSPSLTHSTLAASKLSPLPQSSQYLKHPEDIAGSSPNSLSGTRQRLTPQLRISPGVMQNRQGVNSPYGQPRSASPLGTSPGMVQKCQGMNFPALQPRSESPSPTSPDVTENLDSKYSALSVCVDSCKAFINSPSMMVARRGSFMSTPSPLSNSTEWPISSAVLATQSCSSPSSESPRPHPSEKLLNPNKSVMNTSCNVCTCNRSPMVILCKACGETMEGRIRQVCKIHPNQIFLMDLQCCPKCQSNCLKEISG